MGGVEAGAAALRAALTANYRRSPRPPRVERWQEGPYALPRFEAPLMGLSGPGVRCLGCHRLVQARRGYCRSCWSGRGRSRD